MTDINNFDAIEIALASSKQIRSWSHGEVTKPGEIRVKGLKTPTTERVKKIIAQDINDLKAAILSDESVTKAITGTVDPEVLNKVLIPKVIETKYPHLSDEEREQIAVDMRRSRKKRLISRRRISLI